MEQIFAMLEKVHPLPDGLRSYLEEQLKYKVIPRKSHLLKAGHVCRNIYFITTGMLRCYYLKGETEVCSWFMKESDIVISIDSFYNQSPSYEYIQAIENSEVYYISYDELQHIYRTYPAFNINGRILTQIYHQHWANQLYNIRMQTADQRYLWLMENHSELLLRVPAKFIASYLDIAEVTLSKIKTKL